MSLQNVHDVGNASPYPEVSIPPAIVDAVSGGKCILFLGAMASAETPDGCQWEYKNRPPSGGELSEFLAARSRYPHDDHHNLQRVAMHYEFDRAHGGSRNALVEAVRTKLSGDFEPSPALQMLAELPFPIYITTNYDRLFDMALARARTRQKKLKNPIVRVYNQNGQAEHVTPDPAEDRPVLLGHAGHVVNRGSLVFQVRRHGQHRADRDHAGATDTGHHDGKAIANGPHRRYRYVLQQRLGYVALRGPAQAARADRDE